MIPLWRCWQPLYHGSPRVYAILASSDERRTTGDAMKIDPQLLISAYCQGIFPMADDDGTIYWYDPEPRAIIPLDRFHVSHRLARTVRNGGFEIRVDTSFRTVMQECAVSAPGRTT